MKEKQFAALEEELSLHTKLYEFYLKHSEEDTQFEIKAEEQKDCIEEINGEIEFLNGEE